MSARKKTVVTIETDTVLIIRRRSSTRAWCPGCGCVADFVRHEQVSQLRGGDVNGLALAGEIGADHQIAAQDGTNLICLEAALALAVKQNRVLPRGPCP